MEFEKFSDLEKEVWKFLRYKNMNCNPDLWKKGYKDFLSYSNLDVTYDDFAATLIKLRNGYNMAVYDYDGKKFGNFILFGKDK